jgi:hypothetical protein
MTDLATLPGPGHAQPAGRVGLPLSNSADGVQRWPMAEPSTVVLYSLFEEQLRQAAARDAAAAGRGPTASQNRCPTSRQLPAAAARAATWACWNARPPPWTSR